MRASKISMEKLLPQNNVPRITLYCIDTREKKILLVKLKKIIGKIEHWN